jgi:SNF2 family DNA or RNA helicase
LELYEFQREDVEKLHVQPAALILNDLGTGKTVESVARDLKLRDSRPWPREFARTLIVTKLAVIEHWVQHYRELAPSLRVTTILKPREQFLDGLRSADIVILHWQALRRPPRSGSVGRTWHQRDLVPLLYNLQWFHIIADEAHNAKNRKAQQTWVLKHIKTQYKTAVTGTPVTNKPPDLWSLLNWCHPKEYRSFWRFFEQYVEYEVVPPLNYKVPIGVKNVAELQRSIEPYTVRRKKQDVLPELPPSYETTVRVDLDPKQRRAYNDMRDRMVAWLGEKEDQLLTASVVIARLQRLQQLALAHATFTENVVRLCEPSSKLDAVEEILEEAEGEQFVIFSQFRGAIQLLERRLAGRETYSVLTGHTKADARRPAIDNFQAGKVRLFLCTIGAGGEGIDLFAASKCIFLDRSWTTTANDQAIGRLWRNGQVNAVQVINIEARKTIDQYKARQLNIKARWLREMLEGI